MGPGEQVKHVLKTQKGVRGASTDHGSRDTSFRAVAADRRGVGLNIPGR